MSKRDRVPEAIQSSLRSVLNWCGVYKAEQDNLVDLDLDESPARIAHMWRHELLASYRPGTEQELRDRFTMFKLSNTDSQELLVQGPINFTSVCAHHMLPFMGNAWIGYIPNERIVGLSKFSRAVEYWSRQLQLQERLTSQIADFIEEVLEPRATIVVMEAEHLCMTIRGARQPGVKTKTAALRGEAEKFPHIKQEFYQLIRL